MIFKVGDKIKVRSEFSYDFKTFHINDLGTIIYINNGFMTINWNIKTFIGWRENRKCWQIAIDIISLNCIKNKEQLDFDFS